MRCASPPRDGNNQICRFASRSADPFARNASCDPSGDQRGAATPRRSYVSECCSPVVESIRTRSLSHRFSFTFARATTTATDLPSGEICGSLRFAMRSRSDGCHRSACATVDNTPINNTTTIRFIDVSSPVGSLPAELYNRTPQKSLRNARIHLRALDTVVMWRYTYL